MLSSATPYPRHDSANRDATQSFPRDGPRTSSRNPGAPAEHRLGIVRAGNHEPCQHRAGDCPASCSRPAATPGRRRGWDTSWRRSRRAGRLAACSPALAVIAAVLVVYYRRHELLTRPLLHDAGPGRRPPAGAKQRPDQPRRRSPVRATESQRQGPPQATVRSNCATASAGSTKTSPRTKRPSSTFQIQATGMSRMPSSRLRT